LFKGFGSVEIASTSHDAQQALVRRWSAFVVDVGLPDGSGLDFLRVGRVNHPGVAALVLTGSVDRELLSAAHALQASYLLKPASREDLLLFAYRAISQVEGTNDRVANVLAEWKLRHGLSDGETEVLQLAATGHERTRLHEIRCVEASTIKKQVASLIRKTGDTSLEGAVNRLLRATLSRS